MKNPAEKTKYTTIHVPVVLANLIDDLVNSGAFAYSGRSEFVKDALRRFLEKHGHYPKHSGVRLETSTLSLSPVGDVEEERTKLKNDLSKRIGLLQKVAKFLEEENE